MNQWINILSLFFRYIHYDNLNRTRKFLIANQITKWLSHILAWLVYSVAIYIKHNNEDTGLLRLFPIISALVTIPPIFGAIHWAVGIRPSYVTKPINENHESKNPDDSITSLRGQRSRLQITWQLTTILTRFASFSLLAYVYYEHWLEVGVNNIQIAVAITLPYMMVLILGNVAIQLVYQFGSLLEGFMGIFTPNGYLKVIIIFTFIMIYSAKQSLIHIIIFIFIETNIVKQFYLEIMAKYYDWNRHLQNQLGHLQLFLLYNDMFYHLIIHTF